MFAFWSHASLGRYKPKRENDFPICKDLLLICAIKESFEKNIEQKAFDVVKDECKVIYFRPERWCHLALTLLPVYCVCLVGLATSSCHFTHFIMFL